MTGPWFSVSYVRGDGRFKMQFNLSSEDLEGLKIAQVAAGGGGFVVVEQPCHYSPKGLEEAGFAKAKES